MPRRSATLLLGIGATLALAGSVAPWIPHQAAGLNVSAFGLFEMSKLLPAVGSGAVPLLREAFLLPLLTSALLLALVPTFSRSTSRASSWLFRAAGASVALAALPSYPAVLTAHRNPEYRGQLLLATAAFLMVLLCPVARRLPARMLDGLAAVLSLGGLVPSLAALIRVRPLFSELYGAPVGVGWGVAASAIGCAAILATAIAPKRQGPPFPGGPPSG